MLLSITIALVLGICAGIITGLVPGIHVNLVSVMLLSSAPLLLAYTSPLALCIFIIAMCTTHSYLDIVPSIFLGAPSEETVMTILPGHQLLIEGKGYEAVKLTIIGSLGGLLVAIILLPVFLLTFPKLQMILNPWIGYLLIAIMLFMIFKDKQWFENGFVFLITGTLGILVFTLPNLKNPLFPMLSGLFGVSTLIISFKDKVTIPKQELTETISISKTETAQAIVGSTVAGSLTAFFPGLGPAQGAVLATQILRKLSNYGFMILCGGIGTVNFVISVVTLYTIDKARNGAVVVVSKLMENVSTLDFALFIATALTCAGIATLLTLWITKHFATLIAKVNYQKLIATIIVCIVLLTIVLSGWKGILVLFTATALGIIPAELNVARNHAMGCLILPVIVYLIR